MIKGFACNVHRGPANNWLDRARSWRRAPVERLPLEGNDFGIKNPETGVRAPRDPHANNRCNRRANSRPFQARDSYSIIFKRIGWPSVRSGTMDHAQLWVILVQSILCIAQILRRKHPCIHFWHRPDAKNRRGMPERHSTPKAGFREVGTLRCSSPPSPWRYGRPAGSPASRWSGSGSPPRRW